MAAAPARPAPVARQHRPAAVLPRPRPRRARAAAVRGDAADPGRKRLRRAAAAGRADQPQAAAVRRPQPRARRELPRRPRPGRPATTTTPSRTGHARRRQDVRGSANLALAQAALQGLVDPDTQRGAAGRLAAAALPRVAAVVRRPPKASPGARLDASARCTCAAAASRWPGCCSTPPTPSRRHGAGRRRTRSGQPDRRQPAGRDQRAARGRPARRQRLQRGPDDRGRRAGRPGSAAPTPALQRARRAPVPPRRRRDGPRRRQRPGPAVAAAHSPRPRPRHPRRCAPPGTRPDTLSRRAVPAAQLRRRAPRHGPGPAALGGVLPAAARIRLSEATVQTLAERMRELHATREPTGPPSSSARSGSASRRRGQRRQPAEALCRHPAADADYERIARSAAEVSDYDRGAEDGFRRAAGVRRHARRHRRRTATSPPAPTCSRPWSARCRRRCRCPVRSSSPRSATSGDS